MLNEVAPLRKLRKSPRHLRGSRRNVGMQYAIYAGCVRLSSIRTWGWWEDKLEESGETRKSTFTRRLRPNLWPRTARERDEQDYTPTLPSSPSCLASFERWGSTNLRAHHSSYQFSILPNSR